MNVYYGFDSLPKLDNSVVTVGSFDGLHIGHQALLDYLKVLTQECGGQSVVITFSPHPRKILHNEAVLWTLSTLKEKKYLLDSYGIDSLVVIPFNEEFSRLSSQDFITNYLVDKLNMKRMVVGYNHHFGHNKEGGLEELTTLGNKHNFELYELPKQTCNENQVSSTIVRNLLESGDLCRIEEYLARPYFIIADVEEGVVLLSDDNKMLPPDGDYMSRVNGCRDDLQISQGTLTLRSCVTEKNVMIEFISNCVK